MFAFGIFANMINQPDKFTNIKRIKLWITHDILIYDYKNYTQNLYQKSM